jgi:hypothetical protein
MIPRRMIIAGGSGFLGRSLIRLARPTFSDIVVLTRTPQPDAPGVRFVPWDARSDGPWQREVDGAHVLVNYVGRTVDCIKTPENRAQILNSRIDSVNALTRACQQADRPPAVWIQSATAHIHGDTDDEILTDDAPKRSSIPSCPRRGKSPSASASSWAGMAARCLDSANSPAGSSAAPSARGVNGSAGSTSAICLASSSAQSKTIRFTVAIWSPRPIPCATPSSCANFAEPSVDPGLRRPPLGR